MKRELTTGVIAKELDCPYWKVQYLLQSRGIKPDHRIGHLRVFSPAVLDVLRKEIAKICIGD